MMAYTHGRRKFLLFNFMSALSICELIQPKNKNYSESTWHIADGRRGGGEGGSKKQANRHPLKWNGSECQSLGVTDLTERI